MIIIVSIFIRYIPLVGKTSEITNYIRVKQHRGKGLNNPDDPVSTINWVFKKSTNSVGNITIAKSLQTIREFASRQKRSQKEGSR